MMLAMEEATQEGIEEAPFLSLHEAVIYTQLDLTSLREFLDHFELGRIHIQRKALDAAMRQSASLLVSWKAGFWLKFRGATLSQILKRGRFS